MCFNSQTSLIAFLIAFISSILLAQRGKILESTIILFISFIQLNEYYLWENNACNKNNVLLSMITVIILSAQMYVFTKEHLKFNKKKKNPNIYLFIVICVTILLLYEIYKNNYCSIKEKNSHRLKWAVTYSSLVYLYCLLYFFQLAFYDLSSPLVIITLIFGVLYAKYKKSSATDIIGSLWCFMSVIYGPANLLFLN
jgi:hypothetical protein